MTRRRKLWRVTAALFTVVNAGGAGIAMLSGEPLHAAVHVALLVATVVVWRIVPRTHRRELSDTQPLDQRLEHLQQTLDAIALDVERIGEVQRYAINVVAERARSAPPQSPQ